MRPTRPRPSRRCRPAALTSHPAIIRCRCHGWRLPGAAWRLSAATGIRRPALPGLAGTRAAGRIPARRPTDQPTGGLVGGVLDHRPAVRVIDHRASRPASSPSARLGWDRCGYGLAVAGIAIGFVSAVLGWSAPTTCRGDVDVSVDPPPGGPNNRRRLICKRPLTIRTIRAIWISRRSAHRPAPRRRPRPFRRCRLAMSRRPTGYPPLPPPGYPPFLPPTGPVYDPWPAISIRVPPGCERAVDRGIGVFAKLGVLDVAALPAVTGRNPVGESSNPADWTHRPIRRGLAVAGLRDRRDDYCRARHPGHLWRRADQRRAPESDWTP